MGSPHANTGWEAYSFELIPLNAHYTMLQVNVMVVVVVVVIVMIVMMTPYRASSEPATSAS